MEIEIEIYTHDPEGMFPYKGTEFDLMEDHLYVLHSKYDLLEKKVEELKKENKRLLCEIRTISPIGYIGNGPSIDTIDLCETPQEIEAKNEKQP